MPLPEFQAYNDLNGRECLDILHSRFFDLITSIPEFQERFALKRVCLRLELTIDIWGSGKKILHDKFELQSTAPPPPDFVPIEAAHTLTADVDARSNPPDLVREEHGLPIPTAIRNSSGFLADEPVPSTVPPKYPPAPPPDKSKLPANLPNPNARQLGKRRYAAFVEQDYGSWVTGDRSKNEPPIVGAEKIALTGAGSDHAPVQPDFRAADFRDLPEEKVRSIVEDTLSRGQRVDADLSRQQQPLPDEGGTE